MPIVVAPGGSFGATLSFQHQGVAQAVWIGIGLAYGEAVGHAPPFTYAMTRVSTVLDATWFTYTVEVSGIMPTTATTGKLLDAQRFISKTQPVINQQPPNDFGVNNWDDEVYSTTAAIAFRTLSVVRYF